MSAGPATRMHTALLTIAETDEGRSGHYADRAIRGIDHPALEAMDAAAEVMSLESGRVKVEGAITSSTPAAIVDVGGQLLWLEPHDEQALLAVLLRREVQRRKEEAQHA